MRRLLPALLLFASSTALAATPIALPHSGYVLDGEDRPVDATLDATFRLVDRASGAGEVQLWSGSCSITVTSGYYAATLGAAPCAGGALTVEGLGAGEVWLEVTLGSTTLAPRTRLDDQFRSTYARNAGTVGGVALTGLVQKSELGTLPLAPGGVATASTYLRGDGAWATLPAQAVTVASGGGLAGDGTFADALGIAAAGISNGLLANDAASLAPVSGGALTAAGGMVGVGMTPSVARLEVNGAVRLAANSDGCDTNNRGTIRYNGTGFEGCTPSGWVSLTGSGGASGDLTVLAGITRPCNSDTGYEAFDGSAFGACIVKAGAFTLTAVTGAALNSIVTSNTLTPTGFSGAGTLTITGATGFEIVKNGTPTGQTLATVTTSDTFAVRTTTGSVNSVTTSVTVTLGTASSTWSVTTVPPLWNCTSVPTHPGCVSGSGTYASCKALKDDSTFNGGNGTYYVDPDGATATFSSMAVWCDMANGGWTLIQSHVANVTTTQGATVGSASSKYLPLTTMQAFANISSAVRIAQRSGSLSVESADSFPITRLRAGSNVSDDATKNASHFTGTGTAHLSYSCAGNNAWPSVYWACGNGGGMHIFYNGVDVHGFSNNSEDLDVLVK